MNISNYSMDSLMLHFALVFCITFALSWLGLKYLVSYLLKKRIVDQPNSRSMHIGEVPRGGGLIIVFMIVLASVLVGFTSGRESFFVGLTALLIGWAGLSWADDRLDLSAKLRLIIQAGLAVISVLLFGWVDVVFGYELGLLGPILTVIGVLWMANLNNFMDGMDGLAASQAIVASLTLGVWFLFLGDLQLATVCAVTLAASYSFLLWNWRPAKVFMGDVGSVTLGALYAILIVVAANRHQIPVFSLMLIFAVFITDATVTIIRRVFKKEPFWVAHRSHFYQRAGLAGISHTKIVMVAACLMTLCSLFATLSVLYRDIIAQLLALPLILLLMVGYWVIRIERAKEKA